MTQTFYPLRDRVLVRRTEPAQKTESGIFIPDVGREMPTEGIVVAVGSGKILGDGARATPQLKPGDHILFGKYVGAETSINDEKLLIMTEADVLGVYEA